MNKTILKNQLTVCKGLNNALAILRSDRFSVKETYILKNSIAHRNQQLISLLKNKKISFLDRNSYYKKFPDKVGSRSQGIMISFEGELIQNELPKFDKKKNTCLLALDGVEDPQNLGQIIRTAECGGIDGLILSKHRSVSITETVLQVSQGAFVNMNIYQVSNLKHVIKRLKRDDFWVIGIENKVHVSPWYTIEYLNKTLIIMGSEKKGIKKTILDSCDFLGSIPMQGETNSLNVGAAVSAIVFERLRQIQEDK